jgi:hypothetical protein
LGKALSDFLEEFPFAITGVITQHFIQSKPMINEILQQEIWLQKFSRRWAPHSFSDAQNSNRTSMAIDLLSVLRLQADHSFSQIVIGNESWFLYQYQSDHIFAASREEVIPREKATIEAQRVMLTIVSSGVSLTKVDALPSGA